MPSFHGGLSGSRLVKARPCLTQLDSAGKAKGDLINGTPDCDSMHTSIVLASTAGCPEHGLGHKAGWLRSARLPNCCSASSDSQ